MSKSTSGCAAVLIAVLALAPAPGWSQGFAPPGITAALSVDRQVYLPGEPVLATLTLQNGGAEVLARKGFTTQDFRLALLLTGEDGTVITPSVAAGATSPEPLAPDQRVIGGELAYVEEVERVPAGWSWTGTFDLHDSYAFSRAQRYSARASVPIRTYGRVDVTEGVVEYARMDAALWWGGVASNTAEFALTADADADGYLAPFADPRLSAHPEVDCDDANAAVHPGAAEVSGNGLDDDCNADTADAALIASGRVSVQADRHQIGTGSRPGSVKTPLAGLAVRLYDKSGGACAAEIGVTWQTFDQVFKSCYAAPGGAARTDASGAAVIDVPPGDYLMIGMDDPDGSASEVPLRISGDEKYIGNSVGTVASGGTAQKYLQLIEKADGKTVPAKYQIRTGSQLLIIEPEYTEWDGAVELYPFILESVGDWSVTTSVRPPEGFVADQRTLTAEVASTLTAVQFVITDVGSRWVDTEVTHVVKHKGKSETIRSRVGVMLSEKLSRQKGVGRFGDEWRGGRAK